MDERVEFLGFIIFIPYVSVTGWRHLCALWDSGCKHLNLVGDIKVVCVVTSKNIESIDLSIYIYTKHVMWIHSLIFCGIFLGDPPLVESPLGPGLFLICLSICLLLVCRHLTWTHNISVPSWWNGIKLSGFR